MDPAADRRAAFERLAPDLVEPVRRFLLRRTDPDTAEDALAETLLVCWRRLDEVPDPPLPWAYGVARHCLANLDRSARRQQRVGARLRVVDPPRATAPGPEDSVLGEEAAERIREALATLGEADAEVLRLWAWEELAPREIADVLGISANAASVRLHRAKERLRAQL